MKTKKIVPIAGLFFWCAFAYAAKWEPIGGSNGISVLMDASSVKKTPDGKVKAWTIFTYSTPQKVIRAYSDKTYSSEKDLHIYDCTNGSLAMVQSTYYEDQSGVGSVVDTYQYSGAPSRLQFTDPSPDSIGEAMLTEACKLMRK